MVYTIEHFYVKILNNILAIMVLFLLLQLLMGDGLIIGNKQYRILLTLINNKSWLDMKLIASNLSFDKISSFVQNDVLKN